jgi:hypothetical protein
LPFEAIIENIYVTFNTYTTYTFPSGITVYPFLQLYAAPPADNTFVPLSVTRVTANGYSGAVPSHTPRTASIKQLGITLPAGIRILIGGQIRTSGTGTLAQSYNFYYTGGISISQR